MPRQRAQRAPIALASNGILLANVAQLLSPDEMKALRAALPKSVGNDLFVGVPVQGPDAEALLARLDDAAAEAVAKSELAKRSKSRR